METFVPRKAWIRADTFRHFLRRKPVSKISREDISLAGRAMIVYWAIACGLGILRRRN